MTLIIGCITTDYAIIAGDTQLTTNGLEREGRVKKSIEHKVIKIPNDLMFGILGKWAYFTATENNKASYTNVYDIFKRAINRPEQVDKLTFLKDFIPKQSEIDATLVYVNKTESGFNFDSISNLDDGEKSMSSISNTNSNYLFNEPFYQTKDSLVKENIEEFIEKYNINGSLVDNLFLLNNIILDIITKGNTIDISSAGVSHLDINNTVGGYITIQIMTKAGVHFLNYLGSPYNTDVNCLLDKTTNPFSNYLDYNKIIRYIDNLGMLLKNMNNPHNDDSVRASVIELIPKQILHIDKLNIIEKPDLNIILDYINKKYGLGLSNIAIEDDNQDSNEFSFENLIFDTEDNNNSVDVNYLLRFL